MDRDAEMRRLNEAEKHIAATERRITEQNERLARLRAHGQDMAESERFLATLNGTLDAMRQHRVLIVDMLRRIDAGEV